MTEQSETDENLPPADAEEAEGEDGPVSSSPIQPENSADHAESPPDEGEGSPDEAEAPPDEAEAPPDDELDAADLPGDDDDEGPGLERSLHLAPERRKSVIESLVFVANQPITERQIAQRLGL